MKKIFCVLCFFPIASFAAQCENGYWPGGANGECILCGDGYYCHDDQKYDCWDTVVDLEHLASGMRTVVDGVWHVANAWDDTHCVCTWFYSDDRRTTIQYEGSCKNGPTGRSYTYYYWCRTGYYAINPVKWGNWYNDCAPCTNAPQHAHYTSYATPSVMYAVEDNCPWECDCGYVRRGEACVAADKCGALQTGKGLAFTAYAQKTTVPALAVSYNNGATCYVCLDSGVGEKTINIQWGTNEYHTITGQ